MIQQMMEILRVAWEHDSSVTTQHGRL